LVMMSIPRCLATPIFDERLPRSIPTTLWQCQHGWLHHNKPGRVPSTGSTGQGGIRRRIEHCTHSHDASVIGRSKKNEGKIQNRSDEQGVVAWSYCVLSRYVRETLTDRKAEIMICERGLLKGQSRVKELAGMVVPYRACRGIASTFCVSVVASRWACGTQPGLGGWVRGDSTSFRDFMTWHTRLNHTQSDTGTSVSRL
jgi:hypothetical protein